MTTLLFQTSILHTKKINKTTFPHAQKAFAQELLTVKKGIKHEKYANI